MIMGFTWRARVPAGRFSSRKEARPAGTRALRHLILQVVILGLVALDVRASGNDLLLAGGEAEIQPLVRQLAAPRTETHGAWHFWLGTLHGKAVVITRTEGDPLNAVAATTLAVRHFAPKLVVTFGSARAHDPALHAGDVVVSKSFAAFDGLVSEPHPLDGGVHPLTWQVLPHAPMHPGEKEIYQVDFPADSAAAAIALKLKPARGQVVAGVLGSAYQVNREADRIAWIHKTWHTSSEDTESAHVAGCAQLLGVPAVGFRIIDGSPEEAAALAAQFVEALP